MAQEKSMHNQCTWRLRIGLGKNMSDNPDDNYVVGKFT